MGVARLLPPAHRADPPAAARDIVLQPRATPLPGGGLKRTLKPRITIDPTSGEDSVNDGISDYEREVQLPSARDLGLGVALGAQAFRRAGHGFVLFCVDCEAAYSFAVIQRLDWWMHCYLWFDDDGRAIIIILMRVGFGGATSPRRFQSISKMATALAFKRMRDFDAIAPFPAGVVGWQEERRELQRAGVLPEGVEQSTPAALQIYLDDGAGGGGTDPVDVPHGFELAPHGEFTVLHPGVAADGVDAGELASTAIGGAPVTPGTRAAVYLAILVKTLVELGFVISAPKTESGEVIVNLGLRFDVRSGRIDCPPSKQAVLIATIEEARLAAATLQPLHRDEAERLVGRLVNISQVLPELVPYMQGGHRVVQAKTKSRPGRRRRVLRLIKLKHGGAAQLQFLDLMGVAADVVGANEGIPLAPAALFRERDVPGTLTVVTDASGDVADAGAGGYAFLAGSPTVIFMLSEPWKESVAKAIEQSTRPARERTPGAPRFSMPAAELFASWALAEAVARRNGVNAVIAVGDCAPAAAALNAATSPVPQMAELLRGTRRLAMQWLGVAIPREWNRDADRLSHPSLFGAVESDAAHAGLTVVRLAVPDDCWRRLDAVLTLEAGEWPDDERQ